MKLSKLAVLVLLASIAKEFLVVFAIDCYFIFYMPGYSLAELVKFNGGL